VICYFDSSALVKKYTVEVGSERVAEIWESGDLPTLNEAIDRIVQRHPLRGLDAIHLASALHVREESSEQVLFVCGDRRLLAAARAEGLTVVPEKDWRTRPRGRP
jgi:predicted nucleic acid-binding protein